MREAITPVALAGSAKATGFSPAIRAGDFLFLTGATGTGPDGIMPTNAAAQTENALGKVIAILNEAGATQANVVEFTSYHVDISTHFKAIESVIKTTFSAPLPAWTAVEVAGLRRAGALVEFRVVAHHPDREMV